MRRRNIVARLPEPPPGIPEQIRERIGDKLTEGTIFHAQPYKEVASVTAAELSDYHWIAGFLIGLLLFSALVLVVYSQSLNLSLFLGGLFLALLLPLILALLTMRKSYLAVGSIAAGAWMALAGLTMLANLLIPWAPSSDAVEPVGWDIALFALGIPAIVTGARIWRRREPFYGFR